MKIKIVIEIATQKQGTSVTAVARPERSGKDSSWFKNQRKWSGIATLASRASLLGKPPEDSWARKTHRR